MEVEKRGGVKESGYEKCDSSPSLSILLIQDIDILTGAPGRPHHPDLLVTFMARERERESRASWVLFLLTRVILEIQAKCKILPGKKHS